MSGELVEPAYHWCPPYRDTLGAQVAKLAAAAGFAPDAEQALLLDDIFGANDGDMAAFETAVVCARQNLKTGLFKQAALGWLFVTKEPLIVWSSHLFKTTMEAYHDMAALIAGSPWLAKRVESMPKGNSNVAIILKSGQRLMFEARTGTGGRGMSAPKLILDEAFALEPGHMGTLMPLMSKFGGQAQILYGSSAGLPYSAVLRGLRDRGRAGTDPGLCYAEWTDDLPGDCELGERCTHAFGVEGCRLDDERRWQRANPQAGRRITWDYIRKERRALPPAEFARERVSWWDDPADAGQVNDPAKWADSEDRSSEPVGPVRFVLDVSPMSDWSCILAAGDNGSGRTHLEITSDVDDADQLVMDYRPGIAWVVPRLAVMAGRHDGFVVHIVAGSSAESLVPALSRAGVEVEVHPHAEHKQACVHFHAQLHSDGLAHLGQQALTVAVLAGSMRSQSDGLWSWGRRSSSVDICPLNAASLAAWLAQTDDDYDVMDSIG